uniref:Protein kinase domain-containing protein n=1 Tax=Panagrolaimus sp. PS1159 TaxID=55785 RepID=A0AC35FUU5_9BILA
MNGRKKSSVPKDAQPPTPAAAAAPPAPSTGNEKERLDQRLKKKIQAFRARKKEANNPDNNDSQKKNSFSSRKKKPEGKGSNRTVEKEKTDSKKTRDETTVTTDDAIPAGTPAWKTKKVDELVKGDIIFGKRMSCRIADCICNEEHGRVFKAFSTKQIEGGPPPKKDKEDMFPLAVKTDIASGPMKKWFNTEKDVLLAISLLRPGSIAEHFPQIFDSGELYFFRYIMMSLHGPNLERLRRDILKTDFSIGTAVRVAYQMLTTIMDLHLIGYLHRDLKPTNFVIGMDTGSEWFLRGTNLRTVYMVGFGTCVKKKVAWEK